MAGLNLFSIPAGAPFLEVLAQAMLDGRLGPVHRPRRSRRDGADDALSADAAAPPAPSPRSSPESSAASRCSCRASFPLGDVDEAETALIAGAGDALARRAGRTDRRRCERRMHADDADLDAWGRTANRNHLRLDPAEPSLMPATLAEAWGLAGDLAHLLDQMQTEGVSVGAVEGARCRPLRPRSGSSMPASSTIHRRSLARHPGRAACRMRPGRPSATACSRPSASSLLAGDFATGRSSRPARPARCRRPRACLRRIARAPNGAVVLPDHRSRRCPSRAWRCDRPGAGPLASASGAASPARRDRLEAVRDDVRESVAEPIAGAGSAPRSAARVRCCPPRSPNDWSDIAARVLGADGARGPARRRGGGRARGGAGRRRWRFAKTLERPSAHAALVTPDRGLAERVAVELKRWGVEVDDSAGLPLGRWPAGSLLRLALEAVEGEMAPVAPRRRCSPIRSAASALTGSRPARRERRRSRSAAWRGEAIGRGIPRPAKRASRRLPEAITRDAGYVAAPAPQADGRGSGRAAEEVLACAGGCARPARCGLGRRCTGAARDCAAGVTARRATVTALSLSDETGAVARLASGRMARRSPGSSTISTPPKP